MRNKKLQVWLPLLLSMCMVAGMFIGYRIKGNMPGSGIFFTEKQKPVQEVLDLINKKYVENENVDSLGMIAIQAILAKLDPHTIYLPAEILKDVNEDLEGIFYGIGVEFSIINDTTNVVNVLPLGPSEKAGIQIGDQLIKVDTVTIAGNHITAEKLKNMLRGSGGSKIEIGLLRNGSPVKVGVTRGAIPLYSLDASYMITDTIGYIKLNKFSETTYKEFMQALIQLQKDGLKSLILDLRDNGGGILTEATHIADEFLSGNKLITYTEGAHSTKKEYICDKEGIFETGKLIVLANEGSASASEVLMGALQDWDRATIVGRRTFGKGLVQEQFQLSDGSGLRLTVANYFTPLGRSIQKSYSNGDAAYNKDLMDRFNNGEMNSADSIKHIDQKTFITKAGNKLYGGGGITPDVFVGYDTANMDKELLKSYISGTINKFVYLNYLKHQQLFKSFTSIKDFESRYEVDNETLQDFKTYAEKDSIYFNLKNPKENALIKKQIRILTARQIWRTQGYFQMHNLYDDMVSKGIELLKSHAAKISK